MCLVHGEIPVGNTTLARRGGRGMGFRTSGALAALLIGLAASGDEAFAQYPAGTPPRGLSGPPSAVYQPPYAGAPMYPVDPSLMPVDADEDAPFYDPPMTPTVESHPLPPAVVSPPDYDPPP